jgi:hypothetical protein
VVTVGEQVHSPSLLQGRNAVVTKPTPNFTRLDPGRLEIAILVDAMLAGTRDRREQVTLLALRNCLGNG